MLATRYVDQNQHFFNAYFTENSVKIACFYVAYSLCIFSICSNFLRSRSHYDVKVTLYADGWYLFWYRWKEETHSYILLANIRVQDVYYRKSREGVHNPPFGGRVTENASGRRGLNTEKKRCFQRYSLVFSDVFSDLFS